MLNCKKVLKGKLPKHVAIILDGNGRWAKKRNMPRTFGHEAGVKALVNIVGDCNEIGIKELTVFAFSTENWNRPESEIEFLMQSPVDYIDQNLDKLKEKNIKINFVGRKDRFPTPTLDAINKIMYYTKDCTGLVLNVAFDYGGKYDILEATKVIASRVANKDIQVEEIDEQYFASELFVANDVDLLIRTSGELRISNFLLWQVAYAEFYFTKCLWPDFNKKELLKAIKSFQGRKRRFGGLNREVKK